MFAPVGLITSSLRGFPNTRSRSESAVSTTDAPNNNLWHADTAAFTPLASSDHDSFVDLGNDTTIREIDDDQAMEIASTELQQPLFELPSSTPPSTPGLMTEEESVGQQQQQQQQQWLLDWNTECRTREQSQREDWRHELRASHDHSMSGNPKMWWVHDDDGCLAVFESIPTSFEDSTTTNTIIGTLTPGTVVIATDLLVLDEEFRPVIVNAVTPEGAYPEGRLGWTQVVKIESPQCGYVVSSWNGYSFLEPGLVSRFCDPQRWLWRVECPVGAFVREGLDLSTTQVGVIPYGSIVAVKRKMVNAMGLSRLLIQARVKQTEDGPLEQLEGWCSEQLNPLSGQRGMILQPLPFPVPAIYRVCLAHGAVIRSGVELSSPQIGTAPFGMLLTITGRAFTEHPCDGCVERLRLAGNGGWISVRLHQPPPRNLMVVEFCRLDTSFVVNPALFHRDALHRVQREQNNSMARQEPYSPAVSSIEEDATTTDSSTIEDRAKSSCVYSAAACRKMNDANDHCLICLVEPRTATLVHGETGHIVCCLMCARILKARNDPCPVCRHPIDFVIQHFWS